MVPKPPAGEPTVHESPGNAVQPTDGLCKTSGKAPLHITLAYSPAPRVVHELALTLPASAKLRDALAASAGDARFADLQTAAAIALGVWGHPASLDQILHDQDRIEAYRPLRVDPKVARRERFAKQGARTSGLFAKRRPGAKSGY